MTLPRAAPRRWPRNPDPRRWLFMSTVQSDNRPHPSPAAQLPIPGGLRSRTLAALRLVLVRLRFVLMLVAILTVIACWDGIRARWDWLVHPAHEADEAV